jgi:hypothetical protein
VLASNAKEGEFSERTSVKAGRETLMPLAVGKYYARDYNDLMVQMGSVQKRFEAFMLELGEDGDLQRRFLRAPDETLGEAGLLPSGGGLSRKNRLFIALLANQKLRRLLRLGERGVEVPGEFRKRQAPSVRRLLKQHVLRGSRPNAEIVDSTIRRRYFSQAVLTAILTDPVLEKLYERVFSRKEVDLLFDATYAFADRVDPGSAAVAFAAAPSAGKAAVITFSILNVNAGAAVSSRAAIFVDAGVFTKTVAFTESRIFTSTKVVCSLTQAVPRQIDAGDDFELFEDHTVSPKLSEAFRLDDRVVNELSDYAMLADAIVEGLNVMDYGKALEYARAQIEAGR